MNIKKYTIKSLIFTSCFSFFLVSTSFADNHGGNKNNMHNEMEEMKEFHDKITRSVQNTDTGVIVTLTTNDPDALAKIQDENFKCPCSLGTQSKSNIENGTVVTISSDNADEVKKIQDHMDKMVNSNLEDESKVALEQAKEEMKEFHDKITRSVQNTDTGVIVTLTTNDPDALAKIQDENFKCPCSLGTQSKSNIENGTVVTISSDNADEVKKIQDHMDKMVNKMTNKNSDVKSHKYSKIKEINSVKNSKKIRKRISVSVERTENGVVVILTTENENILKALHKRAEKKPNKFEKIENGIKIIKK